ncbi:MAG TPA: SPOR domain-containing protein [Azospirillaceae bacterium]|nr:SPOR domain-containing protein [Azospirillaceae bacterium]
MPFRTPNARSPRARTVPKVLSGAVAAALWFGLPLPVWAQTASGTPPGAASPDPADRDALGNDAVRLMIDRAGRGQAEALLGVLYLRGLRIETDPVVAFAWFERAAREGHPAGIYGAARMLIDGLGVPADPERAKALLAGADPAAFGELADALRRLRLAVGLDGDPAAERTEQAAAPAPQPPEQSPATPPPAAPAPAEPAPPPPAEPVPAPPPQATQPPEAQVAQAEAPQTQVAAAPPPPTLSLPPAERYQITAGRSGDAETLRRLDQRIGREHRTLVAGLDRRVLPVFEGGGLAFVLTIDGLADAAAVERLCTALERSVADCAPKPSEGPVPAATAAATAEQPAGAFVQLATVPEEELARAERARFQRILPPELKAGVDVVVRTSSLADGRPAWTIVVAPFDDIAAARAYCERLKAVRLSCIPRG